MAEKVFQSTRPARGATVDVRYYKALILHFNPRAPRGARLSDAAFLPRPGRFQSTRPARGATKIFRRTAAHSKFQSTRPARGATPKTWYAYNDDGISIHAPREGRDGARQFKTRRYQHFNPRAPRGARLAEFCMKNLGLKIFQSTRPARGATMEASVLSSMFIKFQSTRPARGATRESLV